jgi:hypothetical protein
MNFLNYLVEHRLIRELYKDEKDIELIYKWLRSYFFTNGTNDTTQEEKNYTLLTEKDLVRIDSIFTSFSSLEKLNGTGNLARLMLIHEYLQQGKYDKVEDIYQKLDIEKLESNWSEQAYNESLAGGVGLLNSFACYLNEVTEYLASKGRHVEANHIINLHTNRNNRIRAYADASRGFRKFPTSVPEAIYPFLDSAVTETERLKDYQFLSADPRIMLAYSLSAVGGSKFYNFSEKYVKQLSLNTQTDILQRWIQGIAESGDYYQALSSIPEITILTDRLYLYDLILLEEAIRRPMDSDAKLWLDKRREGWYQEDYGFELTLF